MPEISIVLPTHNGSRFIEESIRSILEQTFVDWELIIVDDASTDETPNVLSKWRSADSRLTILRLTENHRLPGALNEGFARASGSLFTWTSDDNRYRSNALEKMHEFLKRTEADLVYTDYALIGESGEPLGRVRVKPPASLAFHNCVGACFLYRSNVHHALDGYSRADVLAEDYDFWLRAFRKFKLLTLHEDLYLYRVHQNSLSEKRKAEVLRATEALLSRHLPHLRFVPRRSLAQGYFRLASIASEFGERESALRRLRESMLWHPVVAFGKHQRRKALEIIFGRSTIARIRRFVSR